MKNEGDASLYREKDAWDNHSNNNLFELFRFCKNSP